MLTTEQIVTRQGRLGASQMPPALGIDAYGRTPMEIYYELRGELEPRPQTEAMTRGNRLEAVLIDFASEEMGVPFTKCPSSFVHPSGLLVATPDAMSADGKIGVEAKSTALSEHYDGEPDSDQAPDFVLAQCNHQFACIASLELIVVPVALIRFKHIDWIKFLVPREKAIVAQVEAFGINFVQNARKGVPPANSIPSLECLKRLRRTPNKIAAVADEIYARDEEQQAIAKAEAKRAEATRAALIASIQDAEAGRLSDGRIFTYYEIERKAYSVAAGKYRKFAAAKNIN